MRDTADITASDMALAESVLCPGGLLILDDFFNEAWPGVAEGAARHLASGSGLVPVAISGNKFIFTTSVEFAAAYRAALAELPSSYARKSEIAFGRWSWSSRSPAAWCGRWPAAGCGDRSARVAVRRHCAHWRCGC